MKPAKKPDSNTKVRLKEQVVKIKSTKICGVCVFPSSFPPNAGGTKKAQPY